MHLDCLTTEHRPNSRWRRSRRCCCDRSCSHFFHALIDKVWRDDFLAEAYRRAGRNRGSAGVDGEIFTAIESYGVERWLGELARDLRDGTYAPKPVRQLLIPKKQPGMFRPLGIPCIRKQFTWNGANVATKLCGAGNPPSKPLLDGVFPAVPTSSPGIALVDADKSIAVAGQQKLCYVR